MKRLVFVCTGNTCRSPMAEVIARAGAERRGLDIEIASAGLVAGPGAPAAQPARQLAESNGLDLSGHRSAPLSPEMLEGVDYVLGLAAGHVAALSGLLPSEMVRLITEFLPAGHSLAGASIADPYGGDLDDYARAWAEIETAIEALLEHLEEEP